uniref:Uncharacterized protein n=1 Tax=Glossina pallidipes TaxID=7398 RepID=A0A1A9ZKA0_GLOPL
MNETVFKVSDKTVHLVELGIMQAAEAISKLIQERELFKEKVVVNAGGATTDELAQNLATIKTNLSNTPSFEKFLVKCMQVTDEDCAGPPTTAPNVEECMQISVEDNIKMLSLGQFPNSNRLI